jgi:hypothetical protein
MKRLIATAMPFVITLACGGAAKSEGTTPSTQGASSSTCGMAFYQAGYDPGCQAGLDATCCNEEKACAGDAGCRNLHACVERCRLTSGGGQALDRCTMSCGDASTRSSPSYALFDAVGTCSKRAAFGGRNCAWP